MPAANVEPLFRPFRVKSLSLKNRIVMAPMTRSRAVDGALNEIHAAYYRRRAEGGVGLILSEATTIDRPGARNDPGAPLFHGEPALRGWKTVLDAVHDAGCPMGPQLWHTGAVPPLCNWIPDFPAESPSGLSAPGKQWGEVMTEAAIADTIASFARAAADAQRLGFDTIELHGGHGYLFDQFFWEATNLRTDRYGGKTLEQRSRFAVEVVAAIRAAVGPDFPIILRVSQWKQQDYTARLARTPDELAQWLQPLVLAGVDIIDGSQRRYWQAEFPEIDGPDGLNFAGWAKKLTGAATMSVGSVGLSGDVVAAMFSAESSHVTDLRRLLERMDRGEFDLIAVGRVLITDPLWVEKVRAGDTANLKNFDAASLAELV